MSTAPGRTEYGELEYDAWSETADGVFIGTCEHCGEHRPCLWSEDPYTADVYDEHSCESAWCGTCWLTSADDI